MKRNLKRRWISKDKLRLWAKPTWKVFKWSSLMMRQSKKPYLDWSLCWGIYPVALRAISATVPTSFFVLCSLFFVPQGSKKTNPQSNNNYQKRRPKLTENHEKVTPGGVPEALGGGLGTILVPRVARRRKRHENGLGDPPPQGPGWGANFDFLSILWCFFLLFFWVSFWKESGFNFRWIWGVF